MTASKAPAMMTPPVIITPSGIRMSASCPSEALLLIGSLPEISQPAHSKLAAIEYFSCKTSYERYEETSYDLRTRKKDVVDVSNLSYLLIAISQYCGVKSLQVEYPVGCRGGSLAVLRQLPCTHVKNG